MGTVPVKESTEAPAIATARTALTGSARGSVRRPLLYAAAAIGAVLATVSVVGLAVAVVALLLLALTDV
jgi:hypothetical protein